MFSVRCKRNQLDEEKIRVEINDEFKKDLTQLAEDIVREANTLPSGPTAGERENLDIIKHLLKRIAVHQLVIDKQNRRTNKLLIVLSAIMATGAIFAMVGTIFAVLQYFKK
jgi:hypothetical protein